MKIKPWPYNRLKFPKKHILICEDNLLQQKRIVEYLSSIFDPEGDVICSFVPSAIQAISILGTTQVDLIILDRDMPWGNGDYVVEFVKNKKIPIITFSGLMDNNKHLMRLGATYNFNKESVINGQATQIIKGILKNHN